MTAQLSRERLEEKLLEHIKNGGDSEEETMVRMLLAGMDSEPVAVPDVATPETVQALSGVQACFAGGWAYLDESQREIASDVWNACRAAMLKAGPVTAAKWIYEAKKLAEMHGTSFVVFRNGEEPQCADPSKVVISFTDKGIGYPAAPEQEV
ncbi:hypothetical protein BFG07_16435 [Kosakonia cowanii]|uniref:hypothetical protein n=1 Tax=Kosakonia cowanii TaxID=208223 RepID=UPI000B971A79|nr:hypothetical protein [Kosakonia cowanii]AST70112.1 hypothetical protein BFG07_16435 [Kosakonia cowanii]